MPLHKDIRERFSLPPAHHMTRVENLESIFKAGEIYSHNRMKTKGSHQSISNPDVQAARAKITIPVTGRPLHDYVPLYFGFKTPMVAVNKAIYESLLFILFSLDILETSGVVISDGNARSTQTKFTLFSSIDDLSLLDVQAVLGTKYAADSELKRKKQAELLVPDSLPIRKALIVLCFSENTRNTVSGLAQKHGISLAARVNKGWYFPVEQGDPG